MEEDIQDQASPAQHEIEQGAIQDDHETLPAETKGLQWQSSDAAFLNPSALNIPRVQRAWDRQPASPFSRQRLRVGKVWKRPGVSLPSLSSSRSGVSSAVVRRAGDAAAVLQGDSGRVVKRTRHARFTTAAALAASPRNKPVKKMCFDSGFGLGAKVALWEGNNQSPVRKIVTRSLASADGEMVALAEEQGDAQDGVRVVEGLTSFLDPEGGLQDHEEEEEEDEMDEGDVTIEIVNEDGTVVETDAEDLAVDKEWEDEDDEPADGDVIVDDDDDAQHEQSDEGLEDDASAASADVSVFGEGTTEVNTDGVDADPVLDGTDVQSGQTDQHDAEAGIDEELAGQTFVKEDAPESVEIPAATEVILPDGFLSPIKRLPRRRAALRQSGASRRRTLPIQFAPVMLPFSGEDLATEIEQSEDRPEDHPEDSPSAANIRAELDQTELLKDDGTTDDATDLHDREQGDEWEDIDDDAATEETADEGDTVALSDDVDGPNVEMAVDNIHGVSSPVTAPTEHQPSILPHGIMTPKSAPLSSPSKTPSSPVPSIEHYHPRLPLRRSPRRQSTSPLKQSTIWPSDDKPHLIAFTPIRDLPARFSYDVSTDANQSPTTGAEDEPVLLERSASAPPEEAQMSPQRVSRPRLSDDTELLQAFLCRAAESKNERRLSIMGKESISNRRDSDTVRQALASPVRTEVLFDLDPNSPVPRKTSAVTNTNEASAMGDGDVSALKADENQDTMDDVTLPRTRRSGRTSRRANLPNQSTPGPNRISIRGNTENVVLKRSEAQEVAMLTRANTRRNKGTAVMPGARLAKLNGQQTDDSTVEDSFVKPAKEGARNITWAETLVEFYQGGEVAETSFLSTEAEPASDPVPTPAPSIDDVTLTDLTIPPPSETPSKPKIRRLKPAKPTASTPAEASSTSALSEVSQEVETETATSAPTAERASRPPGKRRSRIATPGKALSNSTLLPVDLAPPLAVPEVATAATSTKRKAPISKLPAPSTTSSVSQGKENLIASPPKKKPVLSGTENFVPKFDFNVGRPPKLQQPVMPPPPRAQQGDVVPGLMSPAKKGVRRPGLGNSAGTTIGDEDETLGKRDGIPGLTSPAKKRTRRMGL